MTKQRWLLAVTWLCLAATRVPDPANAGEAVYKQAPGPLAVKTVTLDWKDEKRDRSVPVRIYYPDTSEGKFPVIIFSHGLGGSRDGYAYLGEYWAGFGYVCVHLQHIGSDSAVWQGVPPGEVLSALRKSVAQPQNVINRPLDVSFAIDQLEKLDKDDPMFKGRLDLDHVGMAGHSFGAQTTLAVAGQVFITPGGAELNWAEPRVKAAIAMSESAPRNKQQWDAAFAKVSIPILHMTGTSDVSPVNDAKPADRRVPFDHIPAAADQYLLTLQGGDHMVFSGRGGLNGLAGSTGNPAMDPTFQVLIQQSTTAFWDAYLKSDEQAKKWLSDGGCKSMLGEHAAFEVKGAKGP